MEYAIFVRMKRLSMGIAALSLAACTVGNPEADRPDSAAFTVPAEPVEAPAPARTDSVTPAPVVRAPATATPPVQRTPAQSEPARIQPPPPRDTRPSIPWPPDTL